MHFPENHGELRKHFPWIPFQKYCCQTKTLPKLCLYFDSKSQNITFSGAALVLLCLFSAAPVSLLYRQTHQTSVLDSYSALLLILVQVLAALL